MRAEIVAQIKVTIDPWN